MQPLMPWRTVRDLVWPSARLSKTGTVEDKTMRVWTNRMGWLQPIISIYCDCAAAMQRCIGQQPQMMSEQEKEIQYNSDRSNTDPQRIWYGRS